MILAILGACLILLLYVPQLWIRHVLGKYAKDIPDLRGTGGELAQHLVERFELNGVTIETTDYLKDHFDPESKTIRLSEANFNGKSLTAIAIAAHEVSHAIQFDRQEEKTQLHQKYLPLALRLKRLGIFLFSLVPVVIAVFKIPQLALVAGLIAVLTLLISVLTHVLILPLELEASFGKALPILLEGEYVSDQEKIAVRSILKAAAYTYVASALADIVSIWRWGLILRGGLFR